MLAQPDLSTGYLSVRSFPMAVVIVGVDGWLEYTLPAVESILKYEPNVPIVVVDAASKIPYRNEEESDLPDVFHVRLDQSFSYAGAINAGMEFADADLSIVINNDVICSAPFLHITRLLPRDSLYGMQLIEFGDFRWLGGWIYAISRECREAVGPFDEQFEACGFEDLDYCIRARLAGFSIELMHLPFRHLWGKTRWGIPAYPQVRAQNMNRVQVKHGISIGESWMWRVYE